MIEIGISRISGTGYFAQAAIASGETLIVQGGQILHSRVLDRPEWEGLSGHCFQVEADFFLCPLSPHEVSLEGIWGVNHSCSPNCGFNGSLSLVAMSRILKGEEITFDYAMSDARPRTEEWSPLFQCRCESASCRQIITGDDWRDPQLRKRYVGWFQPYIDRLIRKEQNV